MTQPSRRPRGTSRPDRAGTSRGRRPARGSAVGGTGPASGPGRRARATGAAPVAPVPAPTLANSRVARQIAVLGVVLCALALSLAYPLRSFLAQREELAGAQAEQKVLAQQVAELEVQQSALSDPDYIREQARRRLQYVNPGDTVYVVQAPELPAAADTAAAGPDVARPWYETLWDTVDSDGGVAVDPSVLSTVPATEPGNTTTDGSVVPAEVTAGSEGPGDPAVSATPVTGTAATTVTSP